MGLGVDGDEAVYLDVTHMDPKELDVKLGGVLEIYEKFMGEDPRRVPMKVFPAVHYSMGGMWVDYDLMTSIPGVFSGGEANYEYHGANRLGANALVSCTFDGMKGGPKMIDYAAGLGELAATRRSRSTRRRWRHRRSAGAASWGSREEARTRTPFTASWGTG
jgi:succinate dehydrogenase / fumarate reductase flavoprotein subunit